MQKLIYHVAATLDGYIAKSDGTVPGFAMQGDHVDAYQAQLADYAAIVMGRRTYEAGYAFGMKPGDTPYGPRPHYVFSQGTSLPESEHLSVVSDDALDAIDEIKERATGDIYLCGGGEFAGYLLRHQRIDRLRLKLSPLVYGDGIKLFNGVDEPTKGRLISSTRYESGVMLLEYGMQL